MTIKTLIKTVGKCLTIILLYSTNSYSSTPQEKLKKITTDSKIKKALIEHDNPIICLEDSRYSRFRYLKSMAYSDSIILHIDLNKMEMKKEILNQTPNCKKNRTEEIIRIEQAQRKLDTILAEPAVYERLNKLGLYKHFTQPEVYLCDGISKCDAQGIYLNMNLNRKDMKESLNDIATEYALLKFSFTVQKYLKK
ncbi:MAG: hypothetical protein WC755_05025 [Candidatus Woesearchaeota archaeon]|jgi:hypothetical protein